ncbi:EAL domain-containing protein [uncultured Sulfitobacter sp.]|uniref:EAL domain-containing protein n=1 Tax=uncultured Sulfitobacter sp. TaxID=191468 RepID=UPI00262B6B8C|nr:EAL domain-containing protein [uncultured Sulfitobacter sp.]
MLRNTKRRFADLPPGADSPLNAAVAQRDKDVLQMVEEAVAHNQTLMAYQPIMTAGDQSQTAFYEGLIRILDPTGRVIPARDFITVVEDTELGRKIDTLALRMGTAALSAHPRLRLSINMSARSIGFKPWRTLLNRAIKRDPTLAERLIFEISEASTMLLPELVADFMGEYQKWGVCFAMDRFGSGHMAIRYFRDFFFDVLKIDGQFIRGISTNADNQVITSALLAMAREFDLITVAENVETDADARLVTRLGVDCLQGYYFSAPTTQPGWAQPQQQTRAG